MIIIPPQARRAIVIKAGGVRCPVSGRVVQDRLEGCRRVDKLRVYTSVARGEVIQVAGQQIAVLCDDNSLLGICLRAIIQHEGRFVDSCVCEVSSASQNSTKPKQAGVKSMSRLTRYAQEHKVSRTSIV